MSKRRSNEKPRHLYLVLDDWSQGCSIRKIKLSHEDIHPPLIPADIGRGGDDHVFTGRHTLPSALLRFEARRGEPKSIVGCTAPIIYIPIDEYRLFTLGSASFDMLYMPPPTYDDDGANWKKNFSCLNLPNPTFQCDLVTSYAVHPDKQTIFVSSVEQSPGVVVPATFSFRTAEPMMWRRHGQWQLPFTGRGYFDPRLDAWVGLSGDLDTVGHICSCDVVSTDDAAASSHPALKISKEKLFSMVPAERHIGATLVYMGGGESNFCLLESIHIEDDIADYQSTDSDDETNEVSSVDEVNEIDFDDSYEANDEESVDEELDPKRFLRLTTFSLQYDRNGALTTGNSRQVWYYGMPLQVTEEMLKYPVAFWM
uniref:Uncharacterized protein n=1 Tax=Oryza glumipatula TaxID=40148 RepID=A0A0E0BI27_9ORYZ